MRLVSLIYSKDTSTTQFPPPHPPQTAKAHSMATLHFSFFLPKPTPYRPFHRSGRLAPLPIKAYKVTVEHDNRVTHLEVEPDETILSKALDSGMSVPHDCKLGVCMTCPAKLISGVVDQSEGMLSDDVIERGFALLCASYPRSDCTIRTIPEEELLSLQLATAND